MSRKDTDTTIAELKKLVIQFREERDWGKHHTPKNLAISISLEAAELLEHFQWDDYTTTDKQHVADELADVLIYCFNFADTMDIDIATAFRAKLQAAAIKYPVETFSKGQDRPEDYHRVKQAYRQTKKS
jgi:NTP pyrophosphatase (non-canonical NTP hydrolase)